MILKGKLIQDWIGDLWILCLSVMYTYVNFFLSYRSLNAITTWIKLYLQAEQKKTDFKPETDDFDTVASPVSIIIFG